MKDWVRRQKDKTWEMRVLSDSQGCMCIIKVWARVEQIQLTEREGLGNEISYGGNWNVKGCDRRLSTSVPSYRTWLGIHGEYSYYILKFKMFSLIPNEI